MTNTTDTTTTLYWKTVESAVRHARTTCHDPVHPQMVDRVGERAFAEQCCIWHASFLAYGDALASGEIPTDVCEHCGGRSQAGQGNHALCNARARRGRPTPRIDVVDGRTCDCARCRVDNPTKVDRRMGGAIIATS